MTATPAPRRAAGTAAPVAASVAPPGRLVSPERGSPGTPSVAGKAPARPATLPASAPAAPVAGALATPDPAREAPSAAPPLSRVRPKTPGGGASDADNVLSPGQRAIAAAMSEDRGPDSLDAHVRRLMKDLGLWGYHPLNSIGSRQGWPDWTILGAWEMHRELKRQNGKPTADQLMVGAKIRAAGGDWDLWRPSDLLSGRIASELAALAGLNAGTT